MGLLIVTMTLAVSTALGASPAQDSPAQRQAPKPPRASQTGAPAGAPTAAPGATNVPPATATAATPVPPAAPEESLSSFDRDALTAEYRIAPGDVLQVFVWREPDLSRELRVRPDGYVSVPLLGDLFAVSKTPKRLAAEFAQALSQYVNNPVVTVTLGSSSILRFYVLGKVNKPGEFPLIGRTTVTQALALAGGFLDYAKPEEIKILRQELTVAQGRARTHELVVPVNYKAISQGQSLQQNIALKPGDVVMVP